MIGLDMGAMRCASTRSAALSFSYFARRALGYSLSEVRCEELQQGAQPRLKAEARALHFWAELHAGRLEALPRHTRSVLCTHRKCSEAA